MKLLLLITFCFCSAHAFSQNEKNNPLQMNAETLRKFKGTNNDSLQKLFQEFFRRKASSVNLLANRQGNIAILPQDHMPCVVPNVNNIAKMPNAWNEVAVPFKSPYHPIPNPALPQLSFKYELDNNTGVPSK